MPTWKLELEYEGTRYRGWQMQHNAKSVQAEMEAAARNLFEARAEIFGAEGTDAGVHAISQTAHLKIPELNANITPDQIRVAFNEILPHDINILKVANAPDEFHARNDAVGRYYLYQISPRRTAFGKNLVWWVKDELDAKSMNEAARLLVGRHDFRSFCEVEQGRRQSTIAVVDRAEVFTQDARTCFRISADRFLWKMVPHIVGMLVEIGRGEMTYDAFERLLKFESSVPSKFTAPNSGLFLEKVLYKGDVPPGKLKSVVPTPSEF